MMDRKVAPELYELSRVVPEKFVQRAPTGKFGSYVPHYVIVQWLLATVGPFDWELVEVLRGDSKGTVKQVDIDVRDVIVGCVYRLTCTIDKRRVMVEEVGEVDAYTKTGDGARLKHCTSDALKRCAMRLGVAIQLWCKTPSDHFLPEFLNQDTDDDDEEVGEVVVGGEDQDDEYHTGGVITDPKPFVPPAHVPEQIKAPTGWKPGPMSTDKENVPDTVPPVTIKAPADTWNQLLATLENLPSVTDMKPVWLKHAKQLTGRMVLAGLWKETDAQDLTKLSKPALVEKVTEAHKKAKKKVDSHATF